jgi:hypothetical protein
MERSSLHVQSPGVSRNTIIESTFEVGRRFRCTMRVDCGQLDPGAVIRPVPGEWHPRMPEQLDEEELADWRAGRNAVYQLAALTIGEKGREPHSLLAGDSVFGAVGFAGRRQRRTGQSLNALSPFTGPRVKDLLAARGSVFVCGVSTICSVRVGLWRTSEWVSQNLASYCSDDRQGVRAAANGA